MKKNFIISTILMVALLCLTSCSERGRQNADNASGHMDSSLEDETGLGKPDAEKADGEEENPKIVGLQYQSLNLVENNLIYENVICTDGRLLSYLKKKKVEDASTIELPKEDKCLENVGRKEEVSKNIFRRIAGFWIVCHWNQDFNTTKESDIAQEISNHYLYYCGRVNLSKTFDSYLFLKRAVPEDELNEDREMYLINVASDTITAVSRLYSYFNLEGYSSCEYVTRQKDGTYLLTAEDLSSDCLISYKARNAVEVLNAPRHITFRFDQKGRFEF